MDQKTIRAARRGPGEVYYRALLREQESSGQSLRSFARARGLSAWTLYGWRARLGRTRSRRSRAAGEIAPDLVAVDVVGRLGLISVRFDLFSWFGKLAGCLRIEGETTRIHVRLTSIA